MRLPIRHDQSRVYPQSVTILKYGLLTAISLVLAFALEPSICAQRRSKTTRQRSTPQRSSVNYTQFLHSTKKHQQKCSTCHKLPTKDWQKTSDFPDLTDFPDHDACVACHKPQFFRGASPVICTVCHVRVGPRADDRWDFRKRGEKRQFTIEFPHDKHQDVIAVIPVGPATGLFRRISFASQQRSELYNNCTICHSARISLRATTSARWPDGYLPDALTFKAVPSDHGSCFNCHWKSQPPIGESCDGCHKLAAAAVSKSDLPSRISLKFRHEGGGEKRNHVAECTTCHINITKSASLRGLKPDVPMTSCSECHNKDGLRLDVSTELGKIDKNREFVCVYCHTSDVGRRDPPADHYEIAGREPLTRKSIK